MLIDDVIQFLRLLRVGGIEVNPTHTWVKSSCPLAPVSHAGGSDNTPSFGINVVPDGMSGYNCFTCGSGSLASFMHRLAWTVGATPAVHEFFLSKEFLPTQDGRGDSELTYSDSYSDLLLASEQPSVPVPDEVLNMFPLLEDSSSFEARRVREWFTDRGISIELAYEHGVRLNEEQRSIVFPIVDFDEEGKERIYRLHNRSRVEKAFWYITGEHIGRPDLVWGNSNYWFGITKADLTKPLYLVESETDLFMLRMLRVTNILASCGPLGAPKLRKLQSSPLLYLGFDSDEAGLQYVKKAVEVMHSSALLIRLSWRVVGLKDAGDMRYRSQWDAVLAGRMLVQYSNRRISAQPIKAPVYQDRYAGTL